MQRLILSLLFIWMCQVSLAQGFFRDFPSLVDISRREALLGKDSLGSPIRPELVDDSLSTSGISFGDLIKPLPIYSISQLNSKRPYGWGDMLMIPNVGGQQYISTGIEGTWRFVSLKLQPELVIAQNRRYQGLSNSLTSREYRDRYYVWGNGDFPERLGNGTYTKIWWGQSRLMASFGAFETGVSTENIWWGPGQFNSLSFSNNAPGFPHVTFKTRKPAKTFLGYFETELLVGKLASSQMDPSQNDSLNRLYAKPLPDGKRYLNALMVSYQPKWIPNIRLGFVRTFQVYDSIPRETFLDWLPVFEPFQKSNFFDNDNTVDFDGNGRDQQVVIFGDFRFPASKVELYFEYGRRDHAFNWRDFILSPEHARAYVFGFLKLFDLPNNIKQVQIRAEVTQQQESINRIIRYSGSGSSDLGGRNSWHEHAQARGFSNFGQGLGVGTGQGSNVQTLETSMVKDFDKIGILLERVARDMGFYYRAFGELSERKPWVDYSLGFLYDKKFDNLLLSSKLQLIHARNYQWQLDPASTPEFPKGENLTSIMAQISLVYFWNNSPTND